MNIEQMNRHLAKPVEVVLDDESGDKLLLAPLGIDDLPELVELQGKMASAVKGKGEDASVMIDKEMSASAIKLLRLSIAAGNEVSDQKVIDGVIASNFIKLMPKLFEINSLTSSRDKLKAEKIAKLKERIDGKSNQGTIAVEKK